MSSYVEILAGSRSDLPYLVKSKLVSVLKREGINFSVSVCSAHRNAEELRRHIDDTSSDTAVYVCAAGWAAALPGTVKALLLGKSLATVFGIALPSKDYPDAADAVISIKRLPPGIDVVFGGIGTEGFDSIADEVVRLVREYDGLPDQADLDAVRDNIKPPEFDIDLEEAT